MLQELSRALEASDPDAVAAILVEDVTLRVAVHDEPFHGAGDARAILGTVLDGVFHDSETTELVPARTPDGPAFLLFDTSVAGYDGRAQAVLVVRGDPRISDLTVHLRPLAALQALAQEMGRRLGSPPPAGMR